MPALDQTGTQSVSCLRLDRSQWVAADPVGSAFAALRWAMRVIWRICGDDPGGGEGLRADTQSVCARIYGSPRLLGERDGRWRECS